MRWTIWIGLMMVLMAIPSQVRADDDGRDHDDDHESEYENFTAHQEEYGVSDALAEVDRDFLAWSDPLYENLSTEFGFLGPGQVNVTNSSDLDMDGIPDYQLEYPGNPFLFYLSGTNGSVIQLHHDPLGVNESTRSLWFPDRNLIEINSSTIREADVQFSSEVFPDRIVFSGTHPEFVIEKIVHLLPGSHHLATQIALTTTIPGEPVEYVTSAYYRIGGFSFDSWIAFGLNSSHVQVMPVTQLWAHETNQSWFSVFDHDDGIGTSVVTSSDGFNGTEFYDASFGRARAISGYTGNGSLELTEFLSSHQTETLNGTPYAPALHLKGHLDSDVGIIRVGDEIEVESWTHDITVDDRLDPDRQVEILTSGPMDIMLVTRDDRLDSTGFEVLENRITHPSTVESDAGFSIYSIRSNGNPLLVQDQDHLAPLAPLLGDVTIFPDPAFGLNWTGPVDDDVDSYRVLRSEANGSLVVVADVGGNSWIDDTVGHGITYAYAVTAMDEAGNEGEASNISVPLLAEDRVVPAEPEAVTSEVFEDRVVIAWNESRDEDVEFYRIYRDNRSDLSTRTLVADRVFSDTWEDLNLTTSSTYYYLINSVDRAGNENGPGTWQVSIVFEGPPAVVDPDPVDEEQPPEEEPAWSRAVGAATPLFSGLTLGLMGIVLASIISALFLAAVPRKDPEIAVQLYLDYRDVSPSELE